MRFMMLMIPAGYESAVPGTMPDDAPRIAAMMRYNESLQKAGVLLACDGLHPPSMGSRVSFAAAPSNTATPLSQPWTPAPMPKIATAAGFDIRMLMVTRSPA